MRAHHLLACVAIVPLLFFMLLSIKKVIGLHWVLSFYPFGFALLALALPAERLKACAIGLAVFAGLHVLVVAGIGISGISGDCAPPAPSSQTSWDAAKAIAWLWPWRRSSQ